MARIGDHIADPVGVVHLVASVVNDLDGDPMFIGTTCLPGVTYIGRHGELSQGPVTCLACVMGRQDPSYMRWLFETNEGVAFIRRVNGGDVMVKDRIALDKLSQRLRNPPEQIDNSRSYAGSPMYFYCRLCGHLADVKPESYTDRPRSHCKECEELKKANPNVTESTLKELASAPSK